MRQNKVISFVVATTLILSSSLSAATSLKQYNAMTDNQLLAILHNNRIQIENTAIESRSNDALLTILEEEQYMTPLQKGADYALKGAIVAALVGIPGYLIAAIEKQEQALYEQKRFEQPKIESHLWERAYAVHREFLNELAAGFSDEKSKPKELAKVGDNVMARIAEVSSKYSQSFAPLAEEEVNAILRHYRYFSIETESKFIRQLADNMASRIYQGPQIQSDLKKFFEKYHAADRALGRKKMGLLLATLGGGIWLTIKAVSSDLNDEDEKTYELVKFYKKHDRTDDIQRTIDKQVLVRRALGEKVIRLQEEIYIAETILMMRGVPFSQE